MKLSTPSATGLNLVTAYRPGEVVVADRTLVRPAIVMPDRVVDWPGAALDTLAEPALDALLDLKPELVLLATGETQRFPRPGLLAYLPARGIGFEVMQTGAACRTYNVLAAEDRAVALALLFG